MAVVISGIPKIGNRLETVYSGRKEDIAGYAMLSGISLSSMSEAYRGRSPYYIPDGSDRYLQALVYLKGSPVPEESLPVAVIENSPSSYEESKIYIVGNGLALTDVLSPEMAGSRIVSDVKRISQSIFIILSTSLAEIPMLDGLGSTLPYHLFREVTDESIEGLRTAIMETLSAQEPRITVTEVEIAYDGEHTLACTIRYIISNSNIQSSYIYNVSTGD